MKKKWAIPITIIWLGICALDCYSSFALASVPGGIFKEVNPILSPLFTIMGRNTFVMFGTLAIAMASIAWRTKNRLILSGFLFLMPFQFWAITHNFSLLFAL